MLVRLEKPLKGLKVTPWADDKYIYDAPFVKRSRGSDGQVYYRQAEFVPIPLHLGETGCGGIGQIPGFSRLESFLIYIIRDGFQRMASGRRTIRQMPCECFESVLPSEIAEKFRAKFFVLEPGQWSGFTCCGCRGCGGFTYAIPSPDGTPANKALWVQLWQTYEMGRTGLDWDNAIVLPRTCSCEEFLSQHTMPTEIVDDSEWVGTNISRTITDYNRFVTFDRELSGEELALVAMILERSKCPGWTGVKAKHEIAGTYRFMTTNDTSD